MQLVLDLLNGRIIWMPLLLVVVCKWLATAASFGSGAPGCVFTPSLFMGASAGYLFGMGVHEFWPAGAPDPQAFALVGMGCVSLGRDACAGYGRDHALRNDAELRHHPAADVVLRGRVTSRRRDSRDGRSAAKRSSEKSAGEPTPKVALAHVVQLMKANPPYVRADSRFAEIARTFLSVRVNNLYVVDENRRFVGVVSLHDIKPYPISPSW